MAGLAPPGGTSPQVGMAPGAQWIAAAGCNPFGSCPTFDLTASLRATSVRAPPDATGARATPQENTPESPKAVVVMMLIMRAQPAGNAPRTAATGARHPAP